APQARAARAFGAVRIERRKEFVAHDGEYRGSAAAAPRELVPPNGLTPLPYPKRATGVGHAQIGQHRLTRDRRLPLRHPRPPAVGQVHVEARSEADHAEALPRPDRDSLAHERDDAPRDQAGDLHHPDAGAARGRDDETVALVVLARLVEIGID